MTSGVTPDRFIEMDDLISQFLSITGTDDVDVANGYLEAADGNLQNAVNIYLETSEGTNRNSSSAGKCSFSYK